MKATKLILCIIGVAVTLILPQISFGDVLCNINVVKPSTPETGAAEKVEQIVKKAENDEKLSVYHGSRDLIAKDLFVAGKTFTVSDFMALRKEGERKSSDRALGRELDSLAALGLITRAGNDITVNVTMTQPDLDAIDTRCGEEVVPLQRKEAGKESSIGFRSFDLTEVADTKEMMQIKRIVGEVLLTGKSIATANKNASHLIDTPYEKVITLTETQIIGEGREGPLSEAELRIKTQGVGENSVKLAIATRYLESRGPKGELSERDAGHVTEVLSALPMGLERALALLKQGDIVFSRVPEDIFAQIESMPAGIPSALNNLSPAQAAAVLTNI